MSYRRADWLKVPCIETGEKKAKVARTPMYFFMMEKKQQWEREGRWNAGCNSFKALLEATLPLWQELRKGPPHLIEPYKQQHRDWKDQQRKDLEEVYDTMGRSLADVQREAVRQRKIILDMEMEIERTVRGMGENVTRSSFFVAQFNYLCRTDRDFFPPCEAAVVEFSLERGVMRTWHEFLSPLDSVPEGYKYRCLKHARVTHNLTSEFEYYETDYRVVMESLIQFLGGTNEGKLPPLYVVADHMDAAECITEFIIEQSNARVPLRVFSLPKLMMELHNLPLENVSPDEAYPSEFVAQTLLEEDKYWYHAGLGCQFHESLENSSHCSQAICHRLVFSLTAACNPIYGLSLRQGRHLPSDQDCARPDMHTKLKWTNSNHVKSDRINRFVPTPGGTTTGPQTFDPEMDVEHIDKDNTNFPGHILSVKDMPRTGGSRTSYSLHKTEVSVDSQRFPGRDIRNIGGFLA